jgi:2-hydroxy-3-oxopropionate reductase
LTAIAVIGLGIMGTPMAINLVRAGHDVIGYNRSRPNVDRLVESGGRAAGSIAEAVSGADVIITMLPDSPDVEAVALGENGVLSGARPGTVYIDMSTIRPEVSRRLAEAGRARRIGVLDAPVSGGEHGAIAGTLSIMVGGAGAHLEAVRPILDVLGSKVVHVGAAGAGQTVKAANQLVVAGIIGVVSEAVVFLDAHGLDTGAALSVLAGGLAGNRILDQKAESMVDRRFVPGFRSVLHQKDLGILQQAAREVGAAVPFGALAAQIMGSVVAQGGGGLDHSAMLLIFDQLAGRATTTVAQQAESDAAK